MSAADQTVTIGLDPAAPQPGPTILSMPFGPDNELILCQRCDDRMAGIPVRANGEAFGVLGFRLGEVGLFTTMDAAQLRRLATVAHSRADTLDQLARKQ